MESAPQSPIDKPAGYISLGERIRELRELGVCPTCRDFEHSDVFPDQFVIYEDELIRVVLDLFPRARGQTIVVWKSHHEDFTTLSPQDTATLFQQCTRIALAIKRGLGAEKVYLVTMCDGYPNHLHIQLLPRYAGESIGSKRFVAQRTPLKDGSKTAEKIRQSLE